MPAVAALLVLAGDRQGQDPGGGWGILVIVGTVILAALVLAGIYFLLIRRTRRERTSQGAHRAGPGRS